MKKAIIILFTFLFTLPCYGRTTKNVRNGIYYSPNGNFSYRIPHFNLGETKIKENINKQGGFVQFLEWSHFKRIDYQIFKPTVEKEIEIEDNRKNLLRNYFVGVYAQGIVKYVKDAKIVKESFENLDGIVTYYATMIMPNSSNLSLEKGKVADSCRCMITHTDGKIIYVFTVSIPVNTLKNETFEGVEDSARGVLFKFFKEVKFK